PGLWSFVISSPLLAWQRDLYDAEDRELRRPDDRDADFGHDLAELAQFRRIRFRVALDEERFGRRRAEERARAEHVGQERRGVARDLLPQRRRVRLEDDKLHALVDRL